MAHILCGWELGGNRGHATLLAAVAATMQARGHRVSFALQRVDALGPEPPAGIDVWPAPVTPRLFVNMGPARGRASSLGDILARLGFDDAALVEALLRGWLQLLRTIRPDAVVANYAPFLLTAARGRLPTVAAGTWFNTPPAAMDSFPSLDGRAPGFDEDQVLAQVNLALRRIGSDPLKRLPGLVGASREVAGSIAELDRYQPWRSRALAMPFMAGGMPPLATRPGDEIFVYMPEAVGVDASIWQGLARSRLPVRVRALNSAPDLQAGLAGLGFRVETQAVPFAAIAERSRLVVSHGGHGFVCSAMMAGLPQLVCGFDLEKNVHADAVARLGLGAAAPLGRIEPEGFTRKLHALYDDSAVRAGARTFASSVRGRYHRSLEEEVAMAVESLLDNEKDNDAVTD